MCHEVFTAQLQLRMQAGRVFNVAHQPAPQNQRSRITQFNCKFLVVWSAKPIGQHNKLAKNPQEPQPLSSKLTVSYSSALRLLRPLYLETPQMESMLAAMPGAGDMAVAAAEEEAGEDGADMAATQM